MGFSFSTLQKNLEQRLIYTNPLVWLDPNVSKDEFTELSKIFIVKKIQKVEEYFDYIKSKWIFSDIPLICSASLFLNLKSEMQNRKEDAQKIKKIYIFCDDDQKNKHLKNQAKVVQVISDIQRLIQMIKQNLNQIQLPSFRNFMDDALRTDQIKYSYYLAYLTSSISQQQRKQLIIKFVQSLNGTNTFEREEDFKVQNYPSSFDPEKILKLYTGNTIYLYLNNALKVNSLTKIQEAHILIHDLHLAIKQYSSFIGRKSIPSVLFRGSTLSSNQIQNIKDKIGSEIETLGFLSTSKNEEVAKNGLFRKNVLFKIYIPQFFRDEKYKKVQLRGGYVEIESIVQSVFQNEQEILFNIKSIFSVLKVYSQMESITNDDNLTQQKQMFTIELLFGKDQILIYLNENKKDFINKIHDRDSNATQVCKECNAKLHVVGTISKTRFCLNNFDPKQLFNESFIVENVKNIITGIQISYDQLALRHFNNPNNQKYSLICPKCSSMIKCSGCLEPLCLCSLKIHDQKHLERQYILIERDLPRYLILEMNESQLNLFQNHYLLESQITSSADAFLLMKDLSSFKKAYQQYSQVIRNRKELDRSDYLRKYNIYFNRAQSYRLRKYLTGVDREPMSIQMFEICKEDYRKCYELSLDQPDQTYRQAKAYMSIGIIEDDIAQIIEKEEQEKKLPKDKSKEIYDDAIKSYNYATKILESVKRERQWTNEELLLDISIKNCVGFIHWHLQSFQTAISLFQSLIDSMKSLEKPVPRDEAKYCNNVTCCINAFVKKLEWGDLDMILKYLQKAEKYGKRSYELRLCLFGSKFNLTNNSKKNYEEAQKLKLECLNRKKST